jgi:hypothetical protein
MAITIPTPAEARVILQAAFPGMTLSDSMVEGARYRIAVGLDPMPGQNDIVEKIIKKLINHENRLDAGGL